MVQAIGKSNCLAQADRFIERVPVLSTVSSIVKIALKIINACFLRPMGLKKNSFSIYIEKQNTVRIIFLMMPVFGNLIVWSADKHKEKKERAIRQPEIFPVENAPVVPVIPAIVSVDFAKKFNDACELEKTNVNSSFDHFKSIFKESPEGIVKVLAAIHLAEYYEKEQPRQEKAEKYYQYAAEKGLQEANLKLALFALNKNDLDLAKFWVNKTNSEKLKDILSKNGDRGLTITSMNLFYEVEKNKRSLAKAIIGTELKLAAAAFFPPLNPV